MKCFCQEAEIFSGQRTKMIKIFNLLEKKIFLKTFLWTPRHQIRQPYWNFFARSRKSSTRVSELNKKLRFQSFFFSNSSAGHVKSNSTTVLKTFRQGVETVWLEVQKRAKRTYFFSKKMFFSSNCSPGHSDCIFDKPAKIFLPKVPKVFAQNTIIVKTFFFQNLCSHNFFPWTHRLQFWQACGIIWAKIWIKFCR